MAGRTRRAAAAEPIRPRAAARAGRRSRPMKRRKTRPRSADSRSGRRSRPTPRAQRLWPVSGGPQRPDQRRERRRRRLSGAGRGPDARTAARARTGLHRRPSGRRPRRRRPHRAGRRGRLARHRPRRGVWSRPFRPSSAATPAALTPCSRPRPSARRTTAPASMSRSGSPPRPATGTGRWPRRRRRWIRSAPWWRAATAPGCWSFAAATTRPTPNGAT